MAISKEDVRYIANLARIGLSESEIEHFQKQLEGIFEYIDQLKKLDVSAIMPAAHVLDIKNVTRPDIVKSSLDPKLVMDSAPAKQGQFFKVPKVIEG
jgi:aspartyl-tRNA(Asn)/glutamyl-tRNA(Gln) amidotransferase subunit C